MSRKIDVMEVEKMPRKRTIDPNVPFQSVTAAAKLTGMSVYYIRAGLKNGKIPHIRVGADYRVNLPAFLQMLEEESFKQAQ